VDSNANLLEKGFLIAGLFDRQKKEPIAANTHIPAIGPFKYPTVAY